MRKKAQLLLAPIVASLVILGSQTIAGAQTRSIQRDHFYPTGDQATSVILLQRIAPEEVRLGQPYEYVVNLVNLTNAEIMDVVLVEEMSGALRVDSITPGPTSQSGNQATWRWDSLAPRTTQRITIRGTASQAMDITSCANVTFSTGACSTTHVVEPALALVKTTPAEVIICDPIPVKLVVTNTGTGVARNVRVTDDLPAGWSTSDGRTNVAFDAGNLAAGMSREFTFTAKADRTGSFTNAASASEDGGLTAQASSSTVVRQPVLQLSKTGPAYRYIGRDATFQIAVTNTGDAVARDTVVTDNVPAGTQFVSASDGGQLSGNSVQWRLGDLAPGATQNVSMTVKLTQRGFIRNEAVVRAYCAQAVGEATIEARGIPAILLEVVDIQDPIEVGSSTTYVITVLNQGSAEGTNITINCTLPNEEEFVSADGPTTASTTGKSVSFAPLPSLAPKARATFKVVINGTGVGDVRFKVSMTSDQTTSPVEETESTHIY